MGLLSWLSGRREPDRMTFLGAMVEMVSEADRTYRGLIAIYNQEVAAGMLRGPSSPPAAPTGRGLYKARLLGALFMVAAYMKAGASDQNGYEFLNAASGLATRTSPACVASAETTSTRSAATG